MKRPLIMLMAVLALAPISIATRHPERGAAAANPQGRDTSRPEMRQKMRAQKMGASDGELDRQLAAMNAATGDAKITVMADLLTRLIRERMTMQDSMKSAMAECPMSKDAPAHQHQP